MNDEENSSSGEEEETSEEELVRQAFDRLTLAIEEILSMMGEDNTSLLTDYAVVAVSQTIDDSGRHIASPALIIPRDDELPIHRIKGLLVDALDGLRTEETTTIIVIDGSGLDGDDDGNE